MTAGPIEFLGRVVAAGGDELIVEGAAGRIRIRGKARPGDWVRVTATDGGSDGDGGDGRSDSGSGSGDSSGDSGAGSGSGSGDGGSDSGAGSGSDRGGGGALVVQHLTVVAPSRREAFPLPGGEWHRLRGGDGRRLANLRARAAALAVMREFFARRSFTEIEAPLMVPSPGLELHLDAFSVAGGRFLITSPEYQLKRLLAGGLHRIYAQARCFRRGEAGIRHDPEFTMIEWYRAGEEWQSVADDVEALCAAVIESMAGTTAITYRGAALDVTPRRLDESGRETHPGWERLTVREAMRRHAGVDLEGDEPAGELVRKGRAAGWSLPESARGPWPWDDAFFAIFLEAVEPQLGRGRPTILHDWPAPLCALARRKPGDPSVVERFEAYAGGLELCNGFGELTDPVEQRARLEHDLAERGRRGLPLYPVDERFIAALEEGLPPCAGVALGFDRLMMLACDAPSLREVSAFVADEL